MPEVTIVGAGMAGLTAALRLVERGYDVTMIEQDDFIGGMLRAFKPEGDTFYHEHSYHMFMNWYNNFWAITDELNIRKNFAPRTRFKFLRRGEWPHMTELVNPGEITHFWENLTSGVIPIPDMFLFMYSLVDLLSQPFNPDRSTFLDEYSVNGFMHSRLYSTKNVAALQQKVWETVWSIPSFNSSAQSYRNFLRYGNPVPAPQLLLVKGNKYDYLLKPIEERLYNSKGSFQLHKKLRLNRLDYDRTTNRVTALHCDEVDRSPSYYPSYRVIGQREIPVNDALILAITPIALQKLLTGPIYDADPKLGDVQYLVSEPMGKVELHFTKKLDHIPEDVTVLIDAKYQMTFLDYSQIWPDLHHTLLYVTVSDLKSLLSVPGEERDAEGHVKLDLRHPTTAIEYILAEFRTCVDYNLDDVDRLHTRIQTNTGEELFANVVGSWDYRPKTKTDISNLFLAGTFVQNYADVATVEGAVVSGLQAAEAIRQRYHLGDRIEIIEPVVYPEVMYTALKLYWAPYAMWAKLWAMANDPWQFLNPMDWMDAFYSRPRATRPRATRPHR